MIIPRRSRPSSSAPSGQRIYLGIDQSYTGLAIVQLSTDGVLAPVVGSFPGKKEWGTAQRVLRLFDIEDWLAGVCTAWQGLDIGAICMEGYARGQSFQREESGELAATVRKSLYQHLGRVPCIVNPLQVKKFITGKTKAEKSDIKLWVYKRWGLETSDDNIADAVGLAKIAAALCEGEDGLTGAQQEVLTALGTGDRSWRLTQTQLRELGALPASKRQVPS